MITATGAMNRNTVTFGIRAKLRLTGLLTATGIGTGLALGAGPGLTIRPGVSRPTTMAGGIISESAGSRWALANRFTLGTAAVAVTSETSIPAILSYATRTCSTTPMFATSIT